MKTEAEGAMAPPELEAVEILRRSEQGVCRPFLVRDRHGDVYVVKGVDGPGKAALISELLCVELGLRLGLPLPRYGIMHVPQALIDFTTIDGADELEGGPAFASRLVDNATTLLYPQIDQIPPALQQRVLVFDKWVRNGDRCLTEKGGNVNLLLCPAGRLVVIDHNAAFDMPASDAGILLQHVFSGQKNSFDDLMVRADHHAALDTALADWDTIIALLPDEWVYRDSWDNESLTSPTLDERLKLLQRFADDDFWRLI